MIATTSTGDAARPPRPARRRPRAAACYRHPDREAHIRCVRCERRICPDCMIPASVGFQCPECVREGNKDVREATHRVRRPGHRRPGLGQQGPHRRSTSVAFVLQQVVRRTFDHRFWLIGGPAFDPRSSESVGVADGEYYRLITAAFLHGGIVHLLLNMYALYLFGPPLEARPGPAAVHRAVPGVGARRQRAVLRLHQPGDSRRWAPPARCSACSAPSWWSAAGWAGTPPRCMVLLAINFAYGFLVPRIDWRAHLGGLIAGALCAVAFAYAPAQRRTADPGRRRRRS